MAHLSDPHITTGPLGAAPAQGLYQALGRGLAISPSPALFIITGDLVDRGGRAEYEALYELIHRYPRRCISFRVTMMIRACSWRSSAVRGLWNMAC